jgi:hypothetical protein
VPSLRAPPHHPHPISSCAQSLLRYGLSVDRATLTTSLTAELPSCRSSEGSREFRSASRARRTCRTSAKKRRSVGTRRAPRPAGAATSTRTANGLLLPRVRRARVRRLGEVRGEGHAPTAPKTLRRAQDPSSAVIAGVTRERRRCCRSQRRLPGHAKTNAKRGAPLLNPPTEGFSGRQATSGYADPGVMLSQTWTFGRSARARTGSDSRSTSPFLRPDGSRTSSRLLRFTRRLAHSQI